MNRSKIFLVTGAGGFIGSHIAQCMSRAGYKVRCSIRSGSSRQFIPSSAQIVTAHLEKPHELFAALNGVHTVIHAAGTTRAHTAQEYYGINVEGTTSLIDQARKAGVRRIVFLSSIAARGPDKIYQPVSAYGQSKLLAERVLEQRKGHMETLCLRLTAVYGAGDRDFLTLFKMAYRGFLLRPAADNPVQLIHVSDVAQACLSACRLQVFPPEKYLDLSAEHVSTPDDFVQAMSYAVQRKVTSIKIPIPFFQRVGLITELGCRILGKPPSFDRRRALDIAKYTYTCDISKTKHILGWEPKVNLSQGLSQTLLWYQQNKWLA